MQGTARHRFMVSRQLLAMALAVLAAGACSEDPEQKLRDAGNDLDAAQKQARETGQDLEAKQKRLDEARKQVGEDRQAAAQAEARVEAARAEVSRYATDPIVFREVERRLLDDRKLVDTAVSVRVVQGVVTLTGNVPSAELRAHAGELAETSPGVVKVVNDVQVVGPGSTKLAVPTAPAKTNAPSTQSAAKPATQGKSQ